MEGVRRRLTLSDQMSILDASNLRDLIRVRDDEDDDGRNALAGLTLGAVLGCEEIIRPNPFQQPSRTLLDIIKDEESGAAYREINVDNTNNNNNDNNKQKSWKSFKDRLCLRRAGAAWSSSSSSHHHHPVSNCDFSPDDCRMEISGPSLTGLQRSSFSLISRTSVSTTAPVENVTDYDERESTTIERNNAISSDVTDSTNRAPSEPVVMRLSTALAAEREEQRQAASSETQLEERESTDQSQLVEEERESTVEVAEQEGDQRGVNVVSTGQQQQPLRVSLMALLEETMDHRQSEMILLDEEEEEEEGMEGGEEVVVVERERGGRKEEYICCVCMVRHKGAAFIPCGHTFCRLCSRKLWVNRGNCPLCNGFILEILDIF